jgi:hypothetical protein
MQLWITESPGNQEDFHDQFAAIPGECWLGDPVTGSLGVAERKKMFCRVSGWALILFGDRALVGLI